MRSIQRFYVLLFFVIVAVSLNSTSQTYACSGGGYSEADYVQFASMIVKGTPVAHIDGSSAVVIEVESYLKGEEDHRYLLINPGTKGQRTGIRENVFSTCGRSYLHSTIGKSSYYFLDRTIEGSYSGRSRTFYGQELALFLRDDEMQLYEVTMTEQEYEDFILMETNQAEPRIPTDETYPRSGILRIKTIDGHDYFLPQDTNQLEELSLKQYVSFINDYPHIFDGFPVGCLRFDCIKYSPNQVYIGVLLPDNQIVINRETFSGYDLLFSPTSDAVAIWDENQIVVKVLYHGSVLGHSGRDPIEYTTNITTHSLINADHAAWSPDGRILVYSDEKGMWLWDALTPNAKPKLLIETTADGLPFARYFSPLGRYLAIEHGNRRYNLDLVSGEKLSDGLFSADERNFLVFNSFSDIIEFEHCYVLSGTCLTTQDWVDHWIPFVEDGVVTQDSIRIKLPEIKDIKWIDDMHYAISACGEWENIEYCGVTRAFGQLFSSVSIIALGHDYDYDPASNQFAAIYDDYTISLNNKQIDFSDQLDSPIVEVEWLPSFFDRR